MHDNGASLDELLASGPTGIFSQPSQAEPESLVREDEYSRPREDIDKEQRVKLETRSTFVAWVSVLSAWAFPVAIIVELILLYMGIRAWRGFAAYGWAAPKRLVFGTLFAAGTLLFYIVAGFILSSLVVYTR